MPSLEPTAGGKQPEQGSPGHPQVLKSLLLACLGFTAPYLIQKP